MLVSDGVVINNNNNNNELYLHGHKRVPALQKHLRWLNRVMQDHEARASDLNRKLIFLFFLLFS